METGITGIWPAEQRIEYASLLYHKIKNSDEERKIKKMMEEQEKKKRIRTLSTKKHSRQPKPWGLKQTK